jgi:hypothetical protein
MPNQRIRTTAVDGNVKARYTQKLSWTTVSESHFKRGRANKAAKKVAGRNTMVMMAMVFIDELSCLLALARSMLASASLWVRRAKTYMSKVVSKS